VELVKQWKHKCELFILQCSPDPLKGERVNVGLVLRDASASPPIVRLSIADDIDRLSCLEPSFSIEALEGSLHYIESVICNTADFEERIEQFEYWPDSVDLAPTRAVFTDSIEDELKLLTEQYLERRSADPKEKRASSRQAIFAQMREAFESAGVWALMDHRLPLSDFTRPGDSLKLDCGYLDAARSMYRILHAVSFKTGADAAKALAYSWPLVREGIAQKRNADCEMFAIVSDNLNRKEDVVAFGWDTLERAGMVVQPVSMTPVLAQAARIALRA
jgi:Protein of unknown function (DUF3037)